MRSLFRPLFLLAALYAAAFAAHAADPLYQVRAVSGRYADVRDSVLNAIEGRGLVINTTGHIGDMLQRTGNDLGQTAMLYKEAEMFEFCSAGASRAMMAADPRNIVFCPYSISVYTVPAEPGRVYVAVRPLPDGPAFQPARELIRAILADALD